MRIEQLLVSTQDASAHNAFLSVVMEQRVNIKFCCKLGKTASETYEMLKTVYGDNTLSRTTVFDWFKRFKDGRESVKDDARTGRPSVSRNADSIAKVRELVARDRRMTLRLMAEELNINKETIRQILHEDLGMRKICAKFVPHNLTDEQKQRRVEACEDFVQNCRDNANFLNCIVTGDESWVFQYDPETKRQSMQWAGKTSPRPKKFRLQKSRIKTMLIVFFDTQGIIHKEFVPEGQSVNGAYYLEVMKRLLKRISRVRPQFREKGSWFLLHDNAPAHSSLIVRSFLMKHAIVEINHPPYSPDLAPADFFLFPKVKTVLKGQRFADVEDIKKNVTAELNTVSPDAFVDCFQKLLERHSKCINVNGDYFE